MFRILFVLISFVSIGLLSPAVATTRDWVVVKATAQVSFKVGSRDWVQARTGDMIPNSAWIATGPRGRASLQRGMESIRFHPNTLASITTTGSFQSNTRVHQQSGKLDLEIATQGRPHTTVQTPFLAAVVKGTGFQVSVSGGASEVSVRHGLVQVTAFSSGQRSDVGPGQTAQVDRSRGMTVGTSPSNEAENETGFSAAAPSQSADPAGTSGSGSGKAESSRGQGDGLAIGPRAKSSEATKGNSKSEGKAKAGKADKLGGKEARSANAKEKRDASSQKSEKKGKEKNSAPGKSDKNK